MTLNEAILHAEQKAQELGKCECANEHRQLAAFLLELKGFKEHKKSKKHKKLKKLKFKALKLVFWHFVAIEKALKFYIDSHLDKDPDKPQNLNIKAAKWDFANNFQAFSDNQELILNYIKTKAQKKANKHKYRS